MTCEAIRRDGRPCTFPERERRGKLDVCHLHAALFDEWAEQVGEDSARLRLEMGRDAAGEFVQ
jgi:hypothetical protein